jgi:hypothetical protein
MNFKIWIESFDNKIIIDYKQYETSINQALEEYLNRIEDYYEKIKNFNFENFINTINSKLFNYPKLNNLLNSIKSKNINYIFDQQKQLRDWILSQDYKISSKLREISNQIFVYMDTLSTSSGLENELTEAKNKAALAMNETKLIMEALKTKIINAINLIENWNLSEIIIRPYLGKNEFNSLSLDASTTAEIILDRSRNTSFTIFIKNNEIEIDDILEGGDEDFFKDAKIQSDYFSLIEKLRNPTASKSKTLTLYTARPKQDRNFYLNTKELPANIFLANDFNHVEGLASDLSSSEKRDIWKVRINSKYLVQTLDGRIKYYQTTKNCPFEKLELISHD